jgi:hypothetical protein
VLNSGEQLNNQLFNTVLTKIKATNSLSYTAIGVQIMRRRILYTLVVLSGNLIIFMLAKHHRLLACLYDSLE